jgi:CotH kinase protein/Chitobiase/beta-hexosaminidase C-terminal domain
MVGGEGLSEVRRGRMIRRAALPLAVFPVALLAWACSSEGSNAGPQPEGDGGIASSVVDGSISDKSSEGDGAAATSPNATETPDSSPASTQSTSPDVTQTPGTTSGSDGVASNSDANSDEPTSEDNVTSSDVSANDDTSTSPDGSSAPNDTTGVWSPPGLVSFAPGGGGFETSQVVEMSTLAGETIHYTLDGSVPTLDSPVYDGPLTMSDTTLVRAVISDSGVLTYFAQTYVHIGEDVVDFSSDLPIVIIERHRDTPIDRNANDMRPSSLLVFEPGNDGRSRLVGPATLSHRAGARVRGAYSRDFAQVGYALETWTAGADDDQDVSFLGMPADSDWVLSAPSEMDRALMRNAFAMDLSRTIGRYAPRTKFVEVFLVDNEERDSLTSDDYLGVYTAMEKIKRGADRVNIAKLRETDLVGDALTGGYMFRIDHDENDFTSGGFEFGWVYPDSDEMVLSVREPQVTYITGYLGEFFDCLTDEAFINPTTLEHYSEYIDVPAWIDHHLMNMLTKNVDGLRLSSYFYKDRNAKLVAGPIWDFDRSLGTPHDGRAANPDEWSTDDGTDHMTWGFWGELFQDPDFAAAYWSRWDELRQDAFSAQSLTAMVDEYEGRLTEARERHFERWTEMPPQGSPAEEVEIIRDWLDERLVWVDGQRP